MERNRILQRTGLFTLAFATILMFFSACGGGEATDGTENGGSDRYEITAQVEGLGSQMTRFIGMIGNINWLVDSAMSDATGKITFAADSTLPSGLYYFVFPDNSFIQFLLDKDQEFSMTTTKNDINGAMKVEGSLDNELFYENLAFEQKFQQEFAPLENRYKDSAPGPEQEQARQALDAKVKERLAKVQEYKDKYPNSFFAAFKWAGQNPEIIYPKKPNGDLDTLAQVYHFRMHYWDNVDFSDERLLRTPVIANKLENYITTATDQRIDSVIKYADRVVEMARANNEIFKFVVNQIAIKYRESTIMGGEAIFVHMIDKYFTEKDAFWSNPEELKKIRGEADKLRVSLLGTKAKDITCINLNGQEESLLDLKSPVVVLYIYSYECEHCQERTPVLVQVMNEWKRKGVEVFALCTNAEEGLWKEFVQKNNMYAFHNVYDPKYQSSYYEKYHIDNTPEVYVLDQERNIIAKDLHPNQLPATFRQVLKK